MDSAMATTGTNALLLHNHHLVAIVAVVATLYIIIITADDRLGLLRIRFSVHTIFVPLFVIIAALVVIVRPLV